jgi:hypothetical protein
MSIRLQAILKLARETFTQRDRTRLNDALYNIQGYDYIDSILEENGFERGPSLGKNKFHLRRDGESIGNAVLIGDYRGMQVVPQETPEVVEKHKAQRIPYDAYTSPAALYELWEMEQESKED